MNKLKVMTIFGTRPEAIKMAPLVAELARREECESICCVTAQHREMLDSVLHIFGLTPDYDLDIMEPRQTLSTITSKCLLGMDALLDEAKPDLVLVHGDTSTTFSGALSAFYHQIPVGHVEAGLRTWDKYSVCLLSPDSGGACGGRPADLGQILPLPGGGKPNPGGRHCGASFLSYPGQPEEFGAGGHHRWSVYYR